MIRLKKQLLSKHFSEEKTQAINKELNKKIISKKLTNQEEQ